MMKVYHLTYCFNLWDIYHLQSDDGAMEGETEQTVLDNQHGIEIQQSD